MSTRVSPLRFSMLRPFVLSLLLSLVVLSVASATTIVVDGDSSDWPSGALLTTSPNDGAIDDGYDLEDIYFTNNTTDLFWRVDLYGTPSITFQLYICMNTASTPPPVSLILHLSVLRRSALTSISKSSTTARPVSIAAPAAVVLIPVRRPSPALSQAQPSRLRPNSQS